MKDEKRKNKDEKIDFLEDENTAIFKTKTISKPLNIDNDSTNSNFSNKKKLNRIYISFEARVTIMLFFILALFGTSCGFILEAMNYGKDEFVSYNEISSIKYRVCLDKNEYYNESCLNENKQYITELTNNIPVTFNYKVDLDKNIEYDLGYHIVGNLTIVDKKDNSKELYNTNEVLVPLTRLKDISNKIEFTDDFVIDFKKYNQEVIDYNTKFKIESTAFLNVILYLDEEYEERKISEITIPLSEPTYTITKDLTKNSKKVKISNSEWEDYNSLCIIVGISCLLISVLFIIRLANLVFKVTNMKNKYQYRINQILRDYDKLIVIARDGYESNELKKIIKVSTFKELLDAREILQKPIVYVRVNDVKSEFYVEDENKVYKFTLKEADFQNE